jgi:hypothetical protein
MMGTGHYYFDEMRSSFNLVQNQLFGAQTVKISVTAAAVQKKGT